MAKVSGAKKALMKTIIYVKNLNLDATDEAEMLEMLREKHPVNYHECMNKVLKAPWNKRLKV